jgi:hypothetical protein
LAIGVLPVPLPFSLAIHLPLPCTVRHVAGELICPSAYQQGDGDDHAAELATRVADSMRSLIERYGRP